MSDAKTLAVTVSFCLCDEILDEELDLIEANLGDLLKRAVCADEAEG